MNQNPNHPQHRHLPISGLILLMLIIPACRNDKAGSKVDFEYNTVPLDIRFDLEGRPELTGRQDRLLQIARTMGRTGNQGVKQALDHAKAYRDPDEINYDLLPVKLPGGIQTTPKEMAQAAYFLDHYNTVIRSRAYDTPLQLLVNTDGRIALDQYTGNVAQLQTRIQNQLDQRRKHAKRIILQTTTPQAWEAAQKVRIDLAKRMPGVPVDIQ